VKEEENSLAFILEPICLHVESTRVSGKQSMDYKRPLNDNKISGRKTIIFLKYIPNSGSRSS